MHVIHKHSFGAKEGGSPSIKFPLTLASRSPPSPPNPSRSLSPSPSILIVVRFRNPVPRSRKVSTREPSSVREVREGRNEGSSERVTREESTWIEREETVDNETVPQMRWSLWEVRASVKTLGTAVAVFLLLLLFLFLLLLLPLAVSLLSLAGSTIILGAFLFACPLIFLEGEEGSEERDLGTEVELAAAFLGLVFAFPLATVA